MNFESKELLKPPTSRAAYSDRTAWLMSVMSKLAYEKFESNDKELEELINSFAELTDKASISEKLIIFKESILSLKKNGSESLEKTLSEAGFILENTFDNKGTQAFLAKRDTDKIAVLAFRGTEKNFDDIKTDLNARFYSKDGVKTHTGFRNAYDNISHLISEEITKLDGYSIYITGHSLGGALALVATRALNSDSIAACYTFGSPRVGDSEFGDKIKPPIYRIINAADMVPRVPPIWAIEIVIVLANFIPIPYVRIWLIKFLTNFRGYSHHGDMRYLTACKDDFSDLRVIPNLNVVYRAMRLIARLSVNFKCGATDHSIERYCTKLEKYALKRLKEK